MTSAKKSLGQHWLNDIDSLQAMCDAAEVKQTDTVLEIGPGLGSLTTMLSKYADKVIAVEFDNELAENLIKNLKLDNVQVVSQDILKFNLSGLPKNYKVVANVPYYITSKIVQFLLEAENPPVSSTLLVQKEVAERIAAKPGDMSILAVAAQLYAEPQLGKVVKAELFTPPPEVDSQIITLKRRLEPLFPDLGTKDFFKVVKAGFSERRKKLRSSLSGGLRLPKPEIESVLKKAGIIPDARAQELSLNDWAEIVRVLDKIG